MGRFLGWVRCWNCVGRVPGVNLFNKPGVPLPPDALMAEPPKPLAEVKATKLAQLEQARDAAELAAEESTRGLRALEKIDRDSIRSIREYIAGKPDAPQALKNLEATAVGERVKVRV